MAAAQVTSPRLPSPPPLTEDFIHPKSPISLSEDQGKLENASKVDHGASRRIRPGTKAADIAEGPPVVELGEVCSPPSELRETLLIAVQIESSFALTEHLKALHNAAIHPDSHSVVPINRETAGRLATPPDEIDKAAWLHELCRFLCQKVDAILVALFADSPPCSSLTCPEMRASEWQYLCAVHDPPKSCCAIDYCCHTLDWAATTLTSVKNFPSYGMGRQLDGSSGNQPGQLRQLTNVFRRVYRIFAHAWFQHREMFWHVEHRTGLYIFFKTVCDVYSLIPEDNYTIPPEAEGVEAEDKAEERAEQPVLLRRETAKKDEEQEEPSETLLGSSLVAGNTTKRHRHSPSTGATSVDTVIEENEEDETTAGRGNSEAAERELDVKIESASGPLGEPASVTSPVELSSVNGTHESAKPELTISKPATEANDTEMEDTPVAATKSEAGPGNSSTSVEVTEHDTEASVGSKQTKEEPPDAKADDTGEVIVPVNSEE